jgi:hypothetical protein
LGSQASSLHHHASVVVEKQRDYEVLGREGDLHVEQRSVEISLSDVHDRLQQALPTK